MTDHLISEVPKMVGDRHQRSLHYIEQKEFIGLTSGFILWTVVEVKRKKTIPIGLILASEIDPERSIMRT